MVTKCRNLTFKINYIRTPKYLIINPQDKIPNMHLYCDRWCEKCPVTSRCEIFVPAANLTHSNNQLDFGNYQQTLINLYQWASENNIQPEEIVAGSLADQNRREKNRKNPRTNETSKLAADYRIESMNFKSKYKDKFNQFRQSSISHAEINPSADRTAEFKVQQAFEVIGWYELQMPLKITRAYLGEYESMENEKKYMETNGSAKVVLTSIERSMPAWETIGNYFPELENNCKKFILLLDRIRKRILADFPEAPSFIRPGIDEVVTA
ncbi:MAG: hypothetical protein JNJ99_06675 [Crocinitomicaceae bacterium]|nr:hypothetical protein [Crocinitomicaceae bacterium]